MSIELEREAKTVYRVYDYEGFLYEFEKLADARKALKEAHCEGYIEKVWTEKTTLTNREFVQAKRN